MIRAREEIIDKLLNIAKTKNKKHEYQMEFTAVHFKRVNYQFWKSNIESTVF